MFSLILQSKWPAFNMIKLVAITSITLTSCLDFEFESPYEDINGIYLEYVNSYPFSGRKLLFNGNIGYIISDDSLLCYDFTNMDSVFLLNTYDASDAINDFGIKDGYAFLALVNEGLEIVDLRGTSPTLVSLLEATYSNITIGDDYIYCYAGRWLQIINISDIAHPIQSGVYEFDEDIRHLGADSNYLRVLLWNSVFQLFDLETPYEPFLLCTIPRTDTLVFLSFASKDDYIYLASFRRVLTYQIINDCDLVNIATLDSPLSFLSLSLSGNHCVGFSLSTAILLLDTEYPFLPCISEFVYVNDQPRQAFVHGDCIFVLTLAPSLEIIEIKQVDQ